MSKNNTRTWYFEDDSKNSRNKENSNDVLIPQKTKSKSFNFRNENPPGTIIPNNKKGKNKSGFDLSYNDKIALRELLESKDDIVRVLEYFKQVDSKEIEINAIPETLVINPDDFEGAIMAKTFKVYSGVVTDLQNFCSRYSNHKVQDIVSFLILDGINRYAKKE